MAYSTRYGKPNMTNLPSDLGIAIFKEILETPKLDYLKLQEDTARLEREMIEIRKSENAKLAEDRAWLSQRLEEKARLAEENADLRRQLKEMGIDA